MLIDAYDAVMASSRLANVRIRFFGDGTKLDPEGANPRMIWLPTQDSFGPPDTLAKVKWVNNDAVAHIPLIINGKQVIATSKWLRWAGCQIHLFADFGPEGQRLMESLINELHMALYEELSAAGTNYDVGDAVWSPRMAVSQRSIQVIQPIRVAVPIWATQPAQLLGAVKTTL